MSDDALMILSFKGEVAKVKVPQDGDNHLVTVYTGSNGEDLFLDGTPVDPETGEIIQKDATTDLLSAADKMVRAWEDGGWRLSTNRQKIQALIDEYKAERKLIEDGLATGPEAPEPVSEPEPSSAV